MARELVIELENPLYVSQLMGEVSMILRNHLESVPPVMFNDRPMEYWDEHAKRTVTDYPGELGLLADDAVVHLSEFIDDKGRHWLTVDSGVYRSEQSRILMAVVGLALIHLGAQSAEDPWNSLGLGHDVEESSLSRFLQNVLNGSSLTQAIENGI